MGAVLETDRDRAAEGRVIARMVEALPFDAVALKAPRMSFLDYLIACDGEIRMAVEVKTRKQAPDEIRRYGGLMLKERKLLELQQISSLMQVRTYIAFAFSDGEGEVMVAEPALITGLQAVPPPPRRNYRGLACDEDPVVYLDWDSHLRRIL
jgi:hypothetical protein